MANRFRVPNFLRTSVRYSVILISLQRQGAKCRRERERVFLIYIYYYKLGKQLFFGPEFPLPKKRLSSTCSLTRIPLTAMDLGKRIWD
jgi:hypothetical protein